MQFTHIHCSSRFSRSQQSLETATDAWRKQASVITMTEVGDATRRRALSEAGWNFYQAVAGEAGTAECATLWNASVWVAQKSQVMKLIGRWPTSRGTTLWAVYANTVILKHKTSGHTVLFSTIHTPNDVNGPSGFTPQGRSGPERIAAYKRMITNWDSAIAKLVRENKPNAVVLSADFNLNFRAGWVPTYLKNSFKDLGLAVSWKQFGSRGTFGRAVIDGSLYRGLSTSGSVVIPDVDDSTDHTPFRTVYATVGAPSTPVVSVPADSTPSAPQKTGQIWWNFNDYGDNTVYQIEQI